MCVVRPHRPHHLLLFKNHCVVFHNNIIMTMTTDACYCIVFFLLKLTAVYDAMALTMGTNLDPRAAPSRATSRPRRRRRQAARQRQQRGRLRIASTSTSEQGAKLVDLSEHEYCSLCGKNNNCKAVLSEIFGISEDNIGCLS